MKLRNLSALKREKKRIENEGYLSDCWIAKYSPSNSDKIYHQLRSRKPMFGDKKTKHIPNVELGHFQKLVQNGQSLKKIEKAIQKLKTKKRSSREVLASSASDEHYTPSGYIELARTVMGSIDIDPASSDIAQQWIKAETFYTIQDNGLDKTWNGNLWLNPPYGRYISLWTEKVIQEFDQGNIQQAVILVRPASASAWYMDLSKRFAKCETYRRICFINADGEAQKQPPHGNIFFYLGDNEQRFREVFSTIGVVSKPI